MEEVLDVFGVVKRRRRSRALLCLLLISRLTRVNAFEDTQSTKVGEGYLKLAHGLSAGDEVSGRARRSWPRFSIVKNEFELSILLYLSS